MATTFLDSINAVLQRKLIDSGALERAISGENAFMSIFRPGEFRPPTTTDGITTTTGSNTGGFTTTGTFIYTPPATIYNDGTTFIYDQRNWPPQRYEDWRLEEEQRERARRAMEEAREAEERLQKAAAYEAKLRSFVVREERSQSGMRVKIVEVPDMAVFTMTLQEQHLMREDLLRLHGGRRWLDFRQMPRMAVRELLMECWEDAELQKAFVPEPEKPQPARRLVLTRRKSV